MYSTYSSFLLVNVCNEGKTLCSPCTFLDGHVLSSTVVDVVDSIWNVMAHGDAREGKWRGNWRIEWVASTLHTTSEHGVSSITTADAHTSAASSRLNWRPRQFKWTRVSPKDEIWFLRVCHHISTGLNSVQRPNNRKTLAQCFVPKSRRPEPNKVVCPFTELCSCIWSAAAEYRNAVELNGETFG